MLFEFATASRIFFGEGSIRGIGGYAAGFGSKVMIVTGSDPQRAQGVFDSLQESGLKNSLFSVSGEPTVSVIEEGVVAVRREGCNVIIGVGGGSALDTAKALAALTVNTGPVSRYLEVIGEGCKLTEPSLPCIAVPTTAGTGTEVTRNIVLSSPEHRVKVSLRSYFLLPQLAVVDPELTYTLPADITINTGMDAFAQLIEPFLSCRATPITDALAREGIPRAIRALPRLFEDGGDKAARRDMAVASLFGGMALANSGLGAVHGFAGPVGGMLGAPHGAVCAALLAPVLKENILLAEKQENQPVLERLTELAVLLTGQIDAAPMDGYQKIYDLTRFLNIGGLATHGLTSQDFDEVIQKAKKSSSMKGNPVTMENTSLETILKSAL
ncbi:MAG: iron-containing alcohol dehydrogenase [Anaerolineales bacterium]|nr:iron-containing alcohol dehydrogenase [Anaerolineales bacterium]